MYEDKSLTPLIGARVNAILMSEGRLVFQTDRGLVGYYVDGDCCSTSYFFDFYGVRNLLDNGPVLAFEKVELSPGDVGYHAETWDPDLVQRKYQDCVKVYGYRITTEDTRFGPVSSVFSFRNDSNGYYGGDMYLIEGDPKFTGDLVSLTADKIGA